MKNYEDTIKKMINRNNLLLNLFKEYGDEKLAIRILYVIEERINEINNGL